MFIDHDIARQVDGHFNRLVVCYVCTYHMVSMAIVSDAAVTFAAIPITAA